MARGKTFKPSFRPTFPDEYSDEYLAQSPNVAKSNGRVGLLPIIALFLAFATAIGALLLFFAILTYINDLSALQKEHNALYTITKTQSPEISSFDAQMRQINSDYICWLTIDGTAIDYPVVRGNDNDAYLNKSFYGEDNVFGTLFMDYRCKGGYVPHIIIYGHNSRYGDMFGGLRKFLDEQYMLEHPVITLKINNRLVEYQVFSAIKTDVNDSAYNLDFSAQGAFAAFVEECGAPSGTKQIVTLSTCVSGSDKDERMIIKGALVN